MKRILSLLLVTLLCIALCLPVAAKPKVISWYCIRNSDHKQPIAPSELAEIERHGGVYIDHRHGDDSTDKVVYLTFDAGYENGNVEKILDALKEADAVAAFFVLKHFVTENEELVRRMSEEQHLICNHTAHHKDLSCASRENIAQELGELQDAVERVTGSGCKPYFRPPEGRFSVDMLESVAALGYRTVFWSFAYADWDNAKQPKPDAALAKILENIHNGAVILLHPTSATNAEIMPQLLLALREEGYRFGSLDELCFAR